MADPFDRSAGLPEFLQRMEKYEIWLLTVCFETDGATKQLFMRRCNEAYCLNPQ